MGLLSIFTAAVEWDRTTALQLARLAVAWWGE